MRSKLYNSEFSEIKYLSTNSTISRAPSVHDERLVDEKALHAKKTSSEADGLSILLATCKEIMKLEQIKM